MAGLPVSLFPGSHHRAADRIIPGSDASDNLPHGRREGCYLNSFCDSHCGLPLSVACSGHVPGRRRSTVRAARPETGITARGNGCPPATPSRGTRHPDREIARPICRRTAAMSRSALRLDGTDVPFGTAEVHAIAGRPSAESDRRAMRLRYTYADTGSGPTYAECPGRDSAGLREDPPRRHFRRRNQTGGTPSSEPSGRACLSPARYSGRRGPFAGTSRDAAYARLVHRGDGDLCRQP